MKFIFEFLDGEVWVFTAESVKHYSGHAVLESAVLIWYSKKCPYGMALNQKVERFNIGLYGLRSMWPSGEGLK